VQNRRPVVVLVTGAVLASAAVVAGLRPRRVEVVGESMLPALHPGDRLLLLRLPAPAGAVVAVVDPRDPERTLVKRVAAAPGGAALLPGAGRLLEAGSGYVVLGDNPRASTDSADFGTVPPRLLRGRAVYRYAPPGRRGAVSAARTGG
jgi:hypothetical protein